MACQAVVAQLHVGMEAHTGMLAYLSLLPEEIMVAKLAELISLANYVRQVLGFIV